MTPSTTHITTSGGLISAAFIEAVREADARLPGLTPESFARPGGVWPSAAPPPSRAALEADIAAAWELLVERWDAVWDEIHTMDVSTVRQRWLLPLFEVLDFSPVYLRADVVLDDAGKLRYPLSHRGWDADREMGSAGAPYPTAPVLHTVAPAQKLDERMQGGRGVRVQSPHDTVQAFLNASSVDRWAVVTNGILLRLLREYHHTFTKGYIQFDLESMFETRNYGDFRALYRLCHASRFCPPFDSPPVGGKVGADEPAETDSGPSEAEEAPPSLTPLEAFYRNSLATGIKIGDDLRDQVREAIETLANGFLRTTPSLLQRLTSNQISNIQDPASNTRAFYAEILHIIYRILFLLFAEQRGMMPGRDSLYAETYAIARLRARAEGDILPLMTAQADLGYEAGFGYTDLWEGLKVTFRMVREGCPPLGVFGYDGMLFADDQTPLLAPPSAIRNSDLLHAIRALTLVEREGVLQRISYADLGVEELGSIYESLLDYTPRVTARAESVGGREVPARTFVLDPVGSERKTTGSYYTDDSLVNQLIKTALLPVMHDRLARAGLPVIPPNEIGETGGGLLADYAGLDAARRADGAAALLDLKVCDPAAGSGHFLVKANNMLGAELARVRTGEPYPVEDAVQAARRDVLAHCIYGVDLNPMAVELCKVSLWINASVRDQPLNFLDHHVRCGNSLVGATPELVRDGIAYEAFALGRAGDDREIAKAVRAQNRRERAEFEKGGGVQLSMFQVTRVFEPPDTGAWRSLTELAEVNPQAARERFAAYQSDAATAKARLLADTWTAAFFWPLTPEAPPPPTFSAFRELLALGKDGLTEAQQRMVAALAEKHRFFHWHLAFPDVFEGEAEGGQGGFDVVLGNPPWERIKLQEKEFFAGRAPAIEAARTASERGKLVRQLPRTDPALHRAYVDALHASEALSGFLRNSGRYPLSASGDINTYQIFAGLVRQIVDGRGRVGIVLPTGIATDYYNQDYFAALVENRELVSLYDFENRAKLFPEVDSRFKFSLVTLTGMAAPVEAAEYAFFLHQVDDLAEAERKFALTSADLARINPNTRTCPVFRTRRDAELTAKLYRAAPVLVNETTGENPWGVSF
ncbi:MAG: restriction endonuclease, partial [Anaerolineae bacterium]|nr:restriction endonuclease [Anaerolineae bacterium]